MSAASIIRLKITLDDVEPVVMRRVTVRFGIRLDRLHTIVQAAMGWSNSHLWEFLAGGTGWGPRGADDDIRDGPLDATKATLLGVLSDVGGKSVKYVYDFSDGWEHTIKVEKVFANIPGLDMPFLLEAVGRCPPEDIGGPSGYAEFLAAIRDPNHERHAEFVGRYSTDFNPAAVNVKALEAAVEAIGSRSSAPRRKSAQS
jgi:Plasmid pRiA4b ORF-3-like protein